MTADKLLSALSKVKKTGSASWTACCPAHNDKSPSLAVKELDDGRVLVKCFGGCSIDEILGAVGLEIDDLFPPRPIGDRKRERMPFSPNDVLRLIAKEAMIVAATANAMRTRKLTEKETERVINSAALIQGSLTACCLEGVWK